ncbi:MAG: calcium-translocating P-type ATPase, PMCA-type, partial [Muribaculum sp.]|nr:calcium-translocating P-type ATPase, PMCA-type [Muribaculum sp.]
GQLLSATSLTVDESTLTGEPSCAKTTDPDHFDKEATFRSDHVLRGTNVMEGHGVMETYAVGDATENGKVFRSVQIDNTIKTPLNEQLDRLGKLITNVAYSIAALIIVGRIGVYFINMDFDWIGFITYFLQTIMIAVALIAVAVPEGLPMAVTLSLAYSMKRMLKSNNLVRKMHACETMGAVTVICTDKTGTLTQNRMQVSETNFFGIGEDDHIIAESIAINSTAQLDFSNPLQPKALGNPTEGALLLWLNSRGIDYQSIRRSADVVFELPFTTENKYMATVVKKANNNYNIYVKGAPEIILKMCDTLPDGTSPQSIQELLLTYQNKAMRTLAFACKTIPATDPLPITDGRISCANLQLNGIVAISDPIRTDVKTAIGECISAGIRVTIITGDTVATAREIAREIGLWTEDDTDKAIITGTELSEMSDYELSARVNEIKIIARARPMDKKRFVETLERLGNVVAATGDGTNDAPALKAAHVGLSMGDGTSVAKEASDITIIDNSFASIRRAVMWGRSLYKNIQRFILFQMTVNVAACLIVLCGAFIGMQSPLTVTQMLWVNLIMDTFAAMALASLPPEDSVMKDSPRRRSAFIITPSMWKFIIGTGLSFFVVLLAIMLYFQNHDIFPDPATNIGEADRMSTYEQSLFFTIFVFLQFWNLFNAKAFGTDIPTFKMKGCRGFTVILAIIFFGQIAIVSLGGKFFNVCPLRVSDWIAVIALTSVVAITGCIIHYFTKNTRYAESKN